MNAPELLPTRTSGFAAGTLVHTSEGLHPIDRVKVGDLVLSKSEQDSGQNFKRVLRTFKHRPTRVVRVVYFHEASPDRTRFVDASPGHLIWVTGQGWTEARLLFSGFGENKLLELKDGSHMVARRVNRVLLTKTPNVGWISSFANQAEGMGYEWDFEAQKLCRSGVPAMEDIQFDDDPPSLEVPMYNLEVEEFHTYYVGAEGVWVHNDSMLSDRSVDADAQR